MLLTVRRAAALGALTAFALLLLTSTSPGAQGAKYAIKVTKAEPPKGLSAKVAKLLAAEAIQLQDGAGNKICEVWLRKEVPADATAEQVQNGLTYRELKETTVLGAVRFDKDWTDIRKQKVKAGVYTLRLGFQPEDGDHAGVSPAKEFGVLIKASDDPSPATMEPKAMQEKSQKSIDTGHPAVLMLFPNTKPAAAPQLVTTDGKYQVLNTRVPATAAGKKAALGVGLTLVGSVD
jgi:hypothetical protein